MIEIDVGIQSFMGKENLIAIKLQLNQLRLITVIITINSYFRFDSSSTNRQIHNMLCYL